MSWNYIVELLNEPVIRRAFYIALMVGPIAAVLGVFITLRTMSFFSDAITHGAMAGVALGLLLKLAPSVDSPAMIIVLVVWCSLTSIVLVRMMEITNLRADTVLAVCVTGSVALAVILIQKLRGGKVLEEALFGNILATTPLDVYIILGLCIAIALFLFFNMRGLALCTIDENLARLEQIPVRRLNYGFLILLSITVAFLLKQLGGMLISGLIVIPAAASRSVARSFLQMLILAAIFGLVGAVAGLLVSCGVEDVPTAPAMVLANLAILAFCFGCGLWANRKRKLPPGHSFDFPSREGRDARSEFER